MKRKVKSPNVILAMEINNLARAFYSLQGYTVEPGYKFHKAHHPQEILMWNMALLAYDTFKGGGENIYHDYYLTYDRFGFEKEARSVE
jgi:hypothetical protein